MGMEFLFGSMEVFCNETVAMTVQLCEYIKSHVTVHFKGINLRYVNYMSIKMLPKKLRWGLLFSFRAQKTGKIIASTLIMMKGQITFKIISFPEFTKRLEFTRQAIK